MDQPWDADVLERVRALHLHARQATSGLWLGARPSIRSGHDVVFLDYKPYDKGDSLRDLDWRVLARTDRLVVRRHVAETELGCVILFDASGDLGSTPAKFDTAVRLAATLAYLMHLGGDPVGLYVGAGEDVGARWLPPRAGRRHLARLFAELARVKPGGRAGLDGLFREVGSRLGLRTLVAVVSDFMEDPATWAPALAALVRNRVDLRALQVYDAAELGLDWTEPTRVRSPETGDELPLDPVAARPLFVAEVDRWFAEVRDAVHARGGQHLRVAAGGDLAPVLAHLLRGRPVAAGGWRPTTAGAP